MNAIDRACMACSLLQMLGARRIIELRNHARAEASAALRGAAKAIDANDDPAFVRERDRLLLADAKLHACDQQLAVFAREGRARA